MSRRSLKSERGAALLVVLMSATLLIGLGSGLLMLTMTEVRVASHFSSGLEALYAADGAIERVLPDLVAAPDWNSVLDGSTISSFVDGAPGMRQLRDGATLDLVASTNLERCGRSGPCADGEMEAKTAERPLGRDNPKWQLYAHGPATDLLPAGEIESAIYVVVWVGDDPLESDGDPLRDGAAGVSPGHAVLMLRARAYGRHAVRRTVEAVIARDPTGLRVLSWREL